MIKSLSALLCTLGSLTTSFGQTLPNRPDLTLDEQSAWVVNTTRVSQQLSLEASQKQTISSAFVSFDQSEKAIIEHGAATGDQLSTLNHRLASLVLGALSATQRKRLHQIALQLKGPYCLDDKPIADEIGLSGEQRAKVHEIVDKSQARDDEYSSNAAEFFSNHPHSTVAQRSKIATDLEPQQRKLAKSKRLDAEAILKVLNSDQREKWTHALGERMP